MGNREANINWIWFFYCTCSECKNCQILIELYQKKTEIIFHKFLSVYFDSNFSKFYQNINLFISIDSQKNEKSGENEKKFREIVLTKIILTKKTRNCFIEKSF